LKYQYTSIEAFYHFTLKLVLKLLWFYIEFFVRMIVTRETTTLFEYYVLVRHHARHAHLFHLNCQNEPYSKSHSIYGIARDTIFRKNKKEICAVDTIIHWTMQYSRSRDQSF